MAIFNLAEGNNLNPRNYLCFTAGIANSTVKLKIGGGSPTPVTFETSIDGVNWNTYTIGSVITLSNIGDKVYRRNSSNVDTKLNVANNYYMFAMSGSISASGDVNYLLNKSSTKKLSGYCYRFLFNGCKALTTPPELPATVLADGCYYDMFVDSGIVIPPKLIATELREYCYERMFYNCDNLETLPKLPATILSSQCYFQMFYGCDKVKLSETQTGDYVNEYRIPISGVGTSASSCFNEMFTDTGGTFTGTPTIDTIYYTSNSII